MAETRVGAALVVGAGVGGMQAALDLAEAGIKAYLLDRGPAIGGKMVQLDKTFPTNDCAMCTISPRLVTIDRHLDIELLMNSDVVAVDGGPGDFTITIRRRARYVDESKCTGCNVCIDKCPVKVTSEFDRGLSKRKAIYTSYPQAVPNVPVIDREHCTYFIKGKCRACEIFCEAKAIRLDDQDKIETIRVGAVILSPGYELFDPTSKPQLGYGRYGNVLTSLQFERMLSASGPTGGEVKRLSDGQPPKRVAFIQCVGSREKEANYCSAVCCMYATKEAIILKEHHPGTEVTIFFTDLRAYGKGFEAYYERAKKLGVNYIRCQPSTIKEIPGSKELVLRHENGGQIVDGRFDMVVLSCGLRPAAGVKELAEAFDVELNGFGFCNTDTFAPVLTSRPGIYAAGVFTGPKDIPETVMEAGAAAAQVLALLSPARGSLLRQKTYPPQRDVTGEEPRIGVFVCHCGKNIASVVSISRVVEYVRTLPGVVMADDSLFACSTDSGEKIKKAIIEHNLNRIVVAACTPRTHEGLFQDSLREAGLNPYLLEMANIRNQCAWVHMNDPEAATNKAKGLVRAAVARVSQLSPLYPRPVTVNRAGLVIGGGVAGLTAALELAGQGFKTYLLEKTAELGGNLRHLHFLISGEDPRLRLAGLISRVAANPLIEVTTGAEIIDFEGSVGNFKTTFKAGGVTRSIEHGAVIVATGAIHYNPTEYQYGQDPRLLTQHELEEKLTAGICPRTVVMIQCIGSRNEEHPYCSRVCCAHAIKNAVKIKEIEPKSNVFILYRDIRAYGLNEAEYTRARELGVRFIRFEAENQPEVGPRDGRMVVSVHDAMLDARLNIPTDLVVLSAGVVPGADNKDLSSKLKVPLNEDGFFLEAHIKLRPVDAPTDGIFLCGLAHGPKLVNETITQAGAAATRAAAILSKDHINLEACISRVVDENCDGCAYCVDPCPFKAISLIEYMKDGMVKKVVEADSGKCHGCGVCMATCPKKGITVRNFGTEHIASMVEAALCGVE